jgi:glutathione S-transferase
MRPELPPPELWHFRLSHFSEKVRWALDAKKLWHIRRSLIPGFHVPRVRRLSGQSRVPVLRLAGRVLHDSTEIIARVDAAFPEPSLYPADPALRRRALALEDYFDETVAPDLRRLFWSAYLDDPAATAQLCTDGFGTVSYCCWRLAAPVLRPAFRRNMGMSPEAIALAGRRLGEYLDRIEAEIGGSGYLAGEEFSIADLTAAAVMTAIIRPPQFPYPLPAPWPRRLVELRDSISDRAGFRWVRDMYLRHRGSSFERDPIS